jgi:hypothetical protein
MNRALKSALLELKADGITLDPIEDLEHILALNTLALRITTPPDPPGERALLQPVLAVGNLTLRHISMGAKRFLIDVVVDWFPGDNITQDLAYAYCMAHTDDPEGLWAMAGSRHAFLKALRCWERTIGTSYEELKAAITKFQTTPQDPQERKPTGRTYLAAIELLDGWRKLPDSYRLPSEAAAAAMQVEESDEAAPFGWMIELLVREYPGTGKTAEDWLWRTPDTEIEAILYNRDERLSAEARAANGARNDRFQRAHFAFRSYLDMIRKLKKATP